MTSTSAQAQHSSTITTDVTPAGNAGVTAVDRLVDAIQRGDVMRCDAWAPAAVVDATVPNWRFTIRGAAAIREEYARWFRDPGSFDAIRRITRPGTEVLEYTLSWTEGGIPHASHHVHILDLDADGAIAHDTVMCGGRWPASLLAQMGEADNG